MSNHGKIAPGFSGSFKIQIDPQNTDVSVKYDISLDKENLANKNIVIKSIENIRRWTKSNKNRRKYIYRNN